MLVVQKHDKKRGTVLLGYSRYKKKAQDTRRFSNVLYK